MKTILIATLLIVSSVGLFAQDAVPTFTVTPSEIDALTENVQIEFDVTGSAVEGLTDVYIWAWAPGLNPSEILLVYDEGSPSWGSISENAKLEPVAGEPNKFTLTLPKTVTRAGTEVTFNNVAELFGVADTPGKIKKFGFLLRSRDGSKQTPGDGATEVVLLPLEFTASYFRTFPAKVSTRDVVSVYLNPAFVGMSDTDGAGEDEKLKIADNFTATVKLLAEDGSILVTQEGIEAKITAEGEHACSFLANRLESYPPDLDLADVKKCQVMFSGVLYNQDGSSEIVSTKTFEFEFQLYQ